MISDGARNKPRVKLFAVAMPSRKLLVAALALAATALPPSVGAQVVVHSDEDLASTRPEAWAMNYVAASTLMTRKKSSPTVVSEAKSAVPRMTTELPSVPPPM